MKRWNPETQEYEAHERYPGALLYSNMMDAPCQCANCGKDMEYGDGYTSFEIQSDQGMGYAVCEACYLGGTPTAERGRRCGRMILSSRR